MDEHEHERADDDLSDEPASDSNGVGFDSFDGELDDFKAASAGRSGGELVPEEQEDDESDDDDDGQETLESVTVEITGLSLYTHHGVSDAERDVGQRLVLDLRLELGESVATATDRVDDTVDYAEVCQLVALIAQQRSYRTLERLCSSIADRLLADYALDGVWVKAAKPEPPIPLPVDEVSVEIWRETAE